MCHCLTVIGQAVLLVRPGRSQYRRHFSGTMSTTGEASGSDLSSNGRNCGVAFNGVAANVETTECCISSMLSTHPIPAKIRRRDIIPATYGNDERFILETTFPSRSTSHPHFLHVYPPNNHCRLVFLKGFCSGDNRSPHSGQLHGRRKTPKTIRKKKKNGTKTIQRMPTIFS